MRTTGNLEEYGKTQNMRLWLVETLNSLCITQEMLPVIDEENFYSIWFEVDREIDKISFKDMKHEFYEVKKRYWGYEAVEIKK